MAAGHLELDPLDSLGDSGSERALIISNSIGQKIPSGGNCPSDLLPCVNPSKKGPIESKRFASPVDQTIFVAFCIECVPTCSELNM